MLIGHSLGGLFLARYLATHTLPVTISTVYLVAAPFFTADTDHGGDFIVNDAMLSLLNERYTIVLLHSKDDQIVPFSDLDAYNTLVNVSWTISIAFSLSLMRRNACLNKASLYSSKAFKKRSSWSFFMLSDTERPGI